MQSGTEETLRSIWGSASSNVYAVGHQGSVLRYDGAGWEEVNAPWGNYEGVWGASPTDIFAVGWYRPGPMEAVILHYDGTDWNEEQSGTGEDLNDVWGTSATDVYAVGKGGTILHFDGTLWSPMESGTTLQLLDVWGTSATDVYAAGAAGTVLHFDGNGWGIMEGSGGGLDPYNWCWGVGGTSPSDVFVPDNRSVLRYDGNSWSMVGESALERPGAYVRGIWAAPDGTVLGVGGGTILRGVR